MSRAVASAGRLRRFRPYPDRTESGLSWLGEAPSHWGLKRAKFQFQRMQRPIRPVDEIVTAFRDGTVTLRANRRTVGFTFADKEIGYQGIRAGDLIVHAMDGFAGAIGVSDSDGKATPVYAAMTPLPDSPAEPRFYAYLLRHLALSGYVMSLARGIRERSTEFRYKEVKELWLPMMPIDEQRAIAEFLDRETGKIDRLVAKKERLIELLQERRTALITHAVTKGLHPTVPMKPSGVEWLGDIPVHWECRKLAYTCSLIRDGTHQPPQRVPSGYPLLSVRNIVDGRLVRLSDDSMISVEDFRDLERSFQVLENDVLLAVVGATLGKVALVPKTDAFTIQRSLAVFRPLPRFLSYCFLAFFFESESFQNLLWQNTGFSAQPGIYLGALGSFHLPVPPREEQDRICENVSRAVSQLDRLIRTIREGAERLAEYRTALISAAVTGKIDVREETL